MFIGLKKCVKKICSKIILENLSGYLSRTKIEYFSEIFAERAF